MDAEIINVGSETLTGDVITNTQSFLVTELANIDVNVYCTNTAGFDPQRLRELLSIALSRSDVVLIVGGMGPNTEDITKQTVCDALGLTLVPHEVSHRRIEEYCEANGVVKTETMMAMANMPAGSVVFRNDSGMCPGCAIRSAKQCIVMLPSSTVELMPMVKNYVSQYLKQLTDGAVFSQVINVFYLGVTLHEVEERLGHLLNNANPTVRCVEMTGEVRIRVTAKTGSEQISREMAAPVIKQIIDLFGTDAYGMNTVGIEEVVVRELKDRKMTLSTAESCTAGIISKRVTDIPGASRVFELGAATYSSNKKSDMLGVSDRIIQRYGAVSPEAAAAMAVGARRLAGSTLAVSTTGIAGPGGGTALKPVGLVYIALADKENVWIRKTLIQKPGMDRDYVRQVAASHALNLVRLYVTHLPYLMPGYEPLGEGVRESYFSETTVMSPQAMKALAASVPVASLGAGNTTIQPSLTSSSYSYSQSTLAARSSAAAAAAAPAAQQQSLYTDEAAAGGKRKKKEARNMSGALAPTSSMSPAVPKKQTKKAERNLTQLIVFYIALIVMLGSGGWLLYDLVIQPHLVESSFDTFREVHSTASVNAATNGVWENGVETEEQDPDRNEDGTLKSFNSLLELNKHIIGWITVPNTVIDYPVVQHPDDAQYAAKGNYYYLSRNIYGENDKNGTIFAYYQNMFNSETLPQNTILFGHHMKSGVMFQNLLKYDVYAKSSNLDFYKQNPVIRFDTKYTEGQWVIFAVVKGDANHIQEDRYTWIRPAFENDADFANFIADTRARSIINTDDCIPVDTQDVLLTLQTCSYEYDNFRTLIIARKLRDDEVTVDVSSATINYNAVMPGVWKR
ncbi:MAG: CinA family nicotinamide mononucleotide deamidase-related protein [Ruminococcaceae bacterium]|nr:CinA family nicotinamide mononucleotide deamidase-related protein [Oscillospiraceae bacterium]